MKPSPDTSLPEDINNKDIESCGRQLESKFLLMPKKPEFGGDILKGQGQLVRMRNLEGGTIWLAPIDLITPNPEQPREYFDPAKMEELKRSIGEHGQEVAVKAVPYLDKETNQIKLFLIDGERRLRAVKALGLKHIRVEVTWKESEEEIFETSLLLNEAREGHNPIEKARAYERMIRYYCKGEKRVKTKAIQKLADKLGLSYATINNYLRLLELDSSIQQMVAEGTLPAYAVLQISSAKKKFGDKLNEAKVAALLLKDMDMDFAGKDDTEGGERRRATRDSVRKAIQRTLVTGGVSDENARYMEAAHVVIRFVSDMGRLRNACLAILNPSLETAVVMHIKERSGSSYPAEVLMEHIQDTVDKLKAVFTTRIKPVITPPLETPKGAPKFTDYVAGIGSEHFTNPNYYAITRILAGASDNDGKLMTADDISAELKKYSILIESTKLGSIMPAINKILPDDLVLDTHSVRRRSASDGKMAKVAGYRLAWKAGVTFSHAGAEKKPTAPPKEPEQPQQSGPTHPRMGMPIERESPAVSAKPRQPAKQAIPRPATPAPRQPAPATPPSKFAPSAPKPPVKPATPLPRLPERSDPGLSAKDRKRSRTEAVPPPRSTKPISAQITLPDKNEVERAKGSFTIKSVPEGLEFAAGQIGTILANARMKLKPGATTLEIRIEETKGRGFIIRSNVRNFQVNGLSYKIQFKMAIAVARNITAEISEIEPAADAAESGIDKTNPATDEPENEKIKTTPKVRFAPELVNVQLMDM